MSTYHEELKNKETQRLRDIQKELPAFTQSFFRGIAQTTSTKTSSVIYTKNTANWAVWKQKT